MGLQVGGPWLRDENKEPAPVLDRLPDKEREMPKQFSITPQLTLRRHQRTETSQPRNTFRRWRGGLPLLATILPWEVLPLAADLHRLDKILQVVLRDPMSQSTCMLTAQGGFPLWSVRTPTEQSLTQLRAIDDLCERHPAGSPMHLGVSVDCDCIIAITRRPQPGAGSRRAHHGAIPTPALGNQRFQWQKREPLT